MGSSGGGPLQAPRGPNGELWRRDGPRPRSWVGARVDRHGNESVLPWTRPFSSAKVIPQKADSWGLLSANTVSTWREKSFISEGGSGQKGTVSTRVGLNSRWDSFVSRLGGHVHPSFSISSLSNVSPWMLKKSQGLVPFPVQETMSEQRMCGNKVRHQIGHVTHRFDRRWERRRKSENIQLVGVLHYWDQRRLYNVCVGQWDVFSCSWLTQGECALVDNLRQKIWSISWIVS